MPIRRALPFLLILAAAACRPATAPVSASAAAAGGEGRGRLVVRTPEAVTNALVDDLQRRSFQFFWETTNPANGLVHDRWPTPSFSSIAAVGFGLTVYPVGAERGWITREQARERVLTTLEFFRNAPQGPAAEGMTGHKGFYYHFLDMQTGARYRDVELSTIDTTLLLAGALFCQSYFDRNDPAEARIRDLAEELYRAADWTFFLTRPPRISMAWKPESGFGVADWRGLNEGAILYILALGSPTHPVTKASWEAWTSTYQWRSFYGYEHVNFGPLFGHQYSHIWIDFRGIKDDYFRAKGIDFFENSRRAVYSQQAYAIDNPGAWRGYGADIWGLTACDGPGDGTAFFDGRERLFWSYSARAAAANEIRDDGTIAPTAAAASIAFAPEIAIPAIQAMKDRYGARLYQKYGFLDSFNPSLRTPPPFKMLHGTIDPELGWFDGDYLGIDQGPIVLMIENYRTGLIWDVMKKNPHIVRGLRQAGFAGGWLETVP
ncbi:MAG TPA: glucoamylase family protein [Thermoanaerobaculia bacterium]|nr:glucoamylase family protein [Thermoanaerobaculia bacterium]